MTDFKKIKSVRKGKDKTSEVSFEKIKKSLAKFSPYLESHGGGVEAISWNGQTGILKVCLQGACHNCAMSQMTLQVVIEDSLKQEFPQIKKVQNIIT